MYKKLRTRFIAYSMIIITVILVFILGGINIANITTNTMKADETLNSLVAQGEAFLTGPEAKRAKEDGDIPERPNHPDDIRFKDERFFVVEKTDDGYLYYLDFTNVITVEEAKYYYDVSISQNKEKNYIDDFRYLKTENRVYFLDCNKLIISQRDFLIASACFSLGGLTVFFVCLWFGSNLIFKNVKGNDEKQKEFITDASHQLKTPLMVISANNDLMEIKNGKSEETETISKEIKTMNEMVSNLLTISKTSEIQKFEKVNISLLLTENINMFLPIFESSKLSITYDVDDDVYSSGNELIFGEIFKIILENANKYAVSKINISLKKHTNYIEFKSSNDSAFKEDKSLMYLTERFVRDPEQSKTKNGSGIGLSLLKVLLSNLKANLDVYSKDGDFNINIRFKPKTEIFRTKKKEH